MPEQAKQLAVFFSLFYFSINAGSLISTTVTPILREDVHCFGVEDCFPLAFGVPAILMIIAIFVFVGGKFLYKIMPNQGEKKRLFNLISLFLFIISCPQATCW